MIEIHKSEERGSFDHGWLKTKHSFSFADYYNQKRMNFGALRVLNEDVIAPGAGFPTHAHANMEIVTIVLDGVLEHRDSSGGHGLIKPGDVQRMSAGRGVRHSEFNASKEYPVHLLQIWIDTRHPNIQPSYEQKNFLWQKGLLKIVSGEKGGNTLYINQDAAFYIGSIGKEITQSVDKEKGVFVFVISGKITLEGNDLETGDAAGITGASRIKIKPEKKSHVLIIEVPMN